MAAFCVNTHSKEFKDTAGRLGISEGTLKLIAYEYGNQEETFGQFPSDNYIMSKVVGRPEMNADDAIVKIWNARYQQAQVFDTPEEFRMAKKEALRFFDADSIGVSSLPDGRIQMVVAEPNSHEEPLISYLSNNEEKVIKGELGVNKQQLISLLGSTMYKSNVQSVAVKELLQNAFDAVKIAKSQGRTERSKIGITLDTANRTVTVTDNGIGMTPEIVQKAFFTIGGSYKGENVDNRLKSGGLGLAKMAFLFSSEAVDVTTVKDGVKTTVHATPDQIQNDNFNIVTSKTTESNGTTVTVKIPESYVDENGNTKTIYFENSPSFLNRPMIGDVEVSVTKVSKNWDGSLHSTTEVFDKNKIPDNYKPIGKATSEFGDIEMYVAPDDSYSIRSEVLISGLHQFSKGFELPGNQRSRFKVILNILPKVGVKSTVYPINNTREGFRATIDPEVKDIAFLLNEINHSLEKKSVAAAFGNTISMDVEEVSDVKRQDTPSDILDSTIEELMSKYPKLAQSQVKSESMDNALNLNEIRMKREAKEKARRSSLDTSGIQFDKGESISAVDTSKLDVRKPMFHNNTTMVLEEDGKKVLEEFGKLMMELKSLYVQTYKDAGLESRFSKDPNSWWGNKIPLMDYLEKQFWGVSFDKEYGGVNVSPVVMPMMAVNPFYRVQVYKGVDTALALTEYITHLIIHEFNHNYQGDEGAGFTGRFPATYAEFAGIGKAFTKDWKNKLYLLIKDNLETFIKYNKRYEEATNLGESFKGDNLTAREEGEGPRTENDGRDLLWNRSGEDVYGKVQTSPERRTIDLQRELDGIKEKAVANGTFMQAPNGQPTKLNEKQWLQVRTKEFKDWFGDWENDPENASKAVDENGEPQVFYHGTGAVFDTFDLRFFGQTDYGDRGVGFYFAYNEKNARPYGNVIMPVFLNIRTPFNGSNHYDAYINRGKTRQQIIDDTKEFILSQAERTIGWMIDQRNSGNTSVYFDENFSKNSTNKEIRDKVLSEANSLISRLSEEIGNLDVTDGYLKGSYEALVTRPDQIKSATENEGTFSLEDNNIYHLTDDNTGSRKLYTKEEQKLLDNTPTDDTSISVAFEGEVAEGIQALRSKVAEIEESYGFKPNSAIPNIGTVDAQQSDSYRTYIKDLQDKIIAKLQETGYNIKVEQDSSITSELAVKSDGQTIILKYNSAKLAKNPRVFEYGVAHELVHTVTAQAIEHSFESSFNPNKEEVDFTNTVLRIANAARKEGITFNIDFQTNKERYAAEFIANAMTNPAMQDRLADIKDPKGKSLWQKFVSAVKNLISKFLGKSISDTYLDTLVSATYAHIEEFNSHRPFGQDSLTSSVQGSEFVNHSGGAIGSDTYWGEVGEKYGVKSNHYYHGAKTPNGNVAITEEQFNEGKEKVLLANKTLNRKPDRYMDLLARNWMQVKNADAVFAVGHLVNGIVDGGTGWAVQMAIDAGKPVYVFDQERGQWYKNIDGKWSESEVPALTKNFAGIGTRQLNEAGKQAIAEAYNKTFGTPQQTSLNIWAGREGRENEDLSNMAVRPFQYDGRSYNSVEQAFQLAKLRFASDITRQPVDVQEAANNPDLTSFDAKRIGKHIRGLDVARWDAEKYGIMKDLIRASFQQNPQALARLLSTGDAVLTHNQETSAWKTEFPRILTEVRSELRATQQQVTVPENNEPMWAPPSVEREFHEKEQTIVTKISNLLSSGDVTVTEVREEANKLMDWISDQLTQYQENPELVWEKFYRDAVGNTLTKEQVIEKVSKMSRRDLIENIHFDVLLNHYAEEVLSQTDENSELFEALDFDELDKLDALKDNINGLAEYGFNRFVKREGFGIKLSDVEGRTFETFETSKEDQVDPDDFNSQDDVDKNSDELGNQQDHWQIENATRDIMDNAAAKVKQAVANCYVLEDNGKKNPDGTPKYDITKDKLNRNERVPDINAIRSIVRWTQGALTVEQMIDKLSAKIETNPWISQIVDMLKDEKQADFQSQFFNTFCKHFQAYSIVKRRADGTYYTMVLNANPALRDAMNTIMVQYKVGQFALVSPETGVVQSNLDAFKGIADSLLGEGDLNEENRQRIVGMVGDALVAMGFPQPADAINRILTNDLKNSVMEGVLSIHKTLTKAVGQENYNPFEFGSANGIRNYVSQLIKPFTDSLEDTMVTSLFDSGKMYQYYITPSWTTKLFQKMHLPDREFREFVLNEFGSSEWFLDPKVNMTEALSPDRLAKMSKEEQDKAILEEKLKYVQGHPNIWRTPWLRTLMSMNATERQEAFQHKVQLNFDKKNYMRGMTDLEYVMSVFTEYLADSNKGEKGVQFANYRFPMLSNKPSNEFVRFRRYEETEFDEILDGYVSIFNQEISRIQTVRTRNLMEGQEGYIANFDIGSEADRGTRGDSFKFLDYLNPYLNGEMKDEPLGKLINRKLNETEKDFLSSQELSSMETMVREKVEEHLNEVAARLIKQYEDSGLINNLKHIEGVGKSNYEVKKLIREFAWNDNFAQANLLQLLVTDKAFYKNEEDLQKRLAQVHSPGVRGNWLAKYDGKSISDGRLRVMKLGDFNETKESIIENLTAVFDQKIKDARADEVDALRALKENVLDAYRKINVVDGQAFVGPTAYRKKAIAFGEWTEEAEKTYNALKEGKANIATLQSIFNPRKPFTYGKVNKSVNAGVDTPIKTLRYGVQYKDSEYMLIMADALIRGQKSVAKKTADGKLKEVVSGRPNLLGAIFDVLEKSAELNPTMGIDFVVFESGVKTGLSGAVSLNEFVNDPNGREGAFTKMWNSVFLGDGQYNQAFVDILDAEDYTTQQAVPEHFMHGDLQWGSQVRVIMPSDLETSYNGQPVVYEFKDPATGEVVKMNKEQIRAAWEENTAKMIRDGVEKLSKELGLDATTPIADRNILISKLLQREILSNSRYGVDLLLACSVDEDGNFRIPLGDPVQSKRVEQLLNSLIKKRINRQKVAGGMLVEVTNFGTSKRLNIRFFDKNGGLLDTRQEYLAKGHTEEEFQTYVKENQNGISHYECFAPAWSREFFQSFADESGNIDVEAIEMLDPDLLKMFGYRLPTEDKYSTAPYKIVGFLPKEAGDGFMQPYETTTIDGSDFDVDKKNLMRMVLDLKSRLLSKKDFYEREGIAEETEETLAEFKKYRARAVSAKAIYNKLLDEYGTTGNITLTTAEREEAEWYEESRKNRRLDVAKVQAINAEDEAVEDVDYRDDLTETYTTFNGQEITYQPLQKTIDELESREDLTSEDEKRIERYKARLKKIQNKYSEKERQIEDDAVKYKERAINNAKKEKKIEKIRELLQQGIFRDSSTVPANQRSLFRAVKKAYIQTLFTVERPAEGTKDYYNNKMFNMQWAIATHPSTTSQMLNPGNFDPQKKIGYMVAANKLGYSWEDLEGLYNETLQIRKGNVEPFNAQDVKEKKASSGIDAIKKLVFTNKNLMDFDIQTQFYRQNAVASQILGIFAVAKSAHAMFESRNYGLMLNRPFVLDGMVFGGLTHYDDKFDRSGVNTIGKTLGSLVSASADAVKDPVLNFMNINKETVNVLNTALRLGVDFETAALLLSSDVVTKALERYRRESLIGKSSFDKVIKAELRTLEGKSYIGADSGLRKQNLSRKEMVWALTNKVREGREQRADEINYKILNAILALSEASKTIQPLSDFSRLNSVSSSTGPLHINTLVSDEKLGPSASMKNIVKFKERFADKDGYVPEYGELVNGVVLTPETAETLVNAGVLERFESYVDATWDMVFDELPSIREFYKSYEIAKSLFKDLGFTTASDTFMKVLMALPQEFKFAFFSKEKLQSSLADFFQSYLLVESGVIKSSELKRYTEDFVKDFMTDKYKEKYADNPLIQAIQPKLISKEGQPDRYALEIDTTGMEQSEKDLLSAGWAQLEKVDTELSHKLFAYNFFRGGIGFNPKSFMGLVPIQVKERIAGYIETFRNIPDTVDPYKVIDQWARNNWNNTDLVTRLVLDFEKDNLDNLSFEGADRAMVRNSLYVKVVTKENGDLLYRRTSPAKAKVITFERIEPLGNNGEYLEMYPSNQNVTALEDPDRGVLTLDDAQIADRSIDEAEVEPTEEEEARELADFYASTYGEEETAETRKERLDEEFDKVNKDLEIQTNKDKFDEILDQFC